MLRPVIHIENVQWRQPAHSRRSAPRRGRAGDFRKNPGNRSAAPMRAIATASHTFSPGLLPKNSPKQRYQHDVQRRNKAGFAGGRDTFPCPIAAGEMAPKVSTPITSPRRRSGAHGRVTSEAPASNQAQGIQHRAGNHGTTHYIGKKRRWNPRRFSGPQRPGPKPERRK